MGIRMEELYQAIEEKIRSAGYPGEISGEQLYDDLCDQIDGRENGEYVLMSRVSEEVWYEYRLQVQDMDFNLSVLTIHDGEQEYTVDFDN